MSTGDKALVRQLGLTDYETTWQAMRTFTDTRSPQTPDELWICEHRPVYTLGQAGRREHILNTAGISVVESDRGGQVTYHGPGQVVVYCLVDLRRAGVSVRDLVVRLEDSAIELLAALSVEAQSRRDAPGVYVGGAKIAALGLRVRKGCTYHGIALNLDLDLKPFEGINPCGYKGMAVTSLAELGIAFDKTSLIEHYAAILINKLH